MAVNKTISNIARSDELEINTNTEKEKENIFSSISKTKNLTELLHDIHKNITRNVVDGNDHRFSLSNTKEADLDFLQRMKKKKMKKEILDYLENPSISNKQKIDRLQEMEIHELIFENTTNTSLDTGIHGFRMGAGGFREYYDFIDLVV